MDFLNDREAATMRQAFNRYLGLLEQTDALAVEASKCGRDHLVALCQEAIAHTASYPMDKLNRWLGFVQGVLACNGVIDVDAEREFTRPLFHALHDRPVKSFG